MSTCSLMRTTLIIGRPRNMLGDILSDIPHGRTGWKWSFYAPDGWTVTKSVHGNTPINRCNGALMDTSAAVRTSTSYHGASRRNEVSEQQLLSCFSRRVGWSEDGKPWRLCAFLEGNWRALVAFCLHESAGRYCKKKSKPDILYGKMQWLKKTFLYELRTYWK